MFSQRKKTVLVVQRRLTQYRVPFFQVLRKEMATRNIELTLAHGTSGAGEATKQDGGELPWAHQLKTKYFFDGRICWQPFGSLARQSDLIVLTHENKLVHNLIAQYFSCNKKIVLWGHGANLQGDASSRRERFKRRTARQADWWLAYTQMSLPFIQSSGFPVDRITVLDNTIDTVTLAEQYASVMPETLDILRNKLRFSGEAIGIFVGSLYGDKRIEYLLMVAMAVRARVPSFELIIAGAGPDREIVETFCARHEWARYVGVKAGQHKAELLALANVFLSPGAVGLGILDSFVCRVPMVTTNCSTHGPEIAYLENDVNGIMTKDNFKDYVEAIVRVLTDREYRSSLKMGCARSAVTYTIENMARHFCDGVEQCLNAPMHRNFA